MIAIIILFISAVIGLFVGINKTEKSVISILLAGVCAAIGISIYQLVSPEMTLEKELSGEGMMYFDFSSRLFTIILLVILGLILLAFQENKQKGTDILGLLVLSTCGGIILSGFGHVVMMFLGIEILSIPLYVLAGSQKLNKNSNEAAMKYFLMGAFSTAILLMGCALIYGGIGSLYLVDIFRNTEMMGHMHLSTPMLKGGTILVAIGFLFKIAAVPFHFWSPDVYDGSPNRATVFMATIVKFAAFAGFMRMLNVGLVNLKESNWLFAIGIISAISILWGNLAALSHKNIKRILAYSGIAQAGYMLMSFLPQNTSNGVWVLITYGLAYTLASVIIFTLFSAASKNSQNNDLSIFNGLAKNNKLATFAIIVAMLSTAGIPLTLGFAAKYALFSLVFISHKWLVIVALLGSFIGVAVYFKFIRAAVLEDSTSNEPLVLNMAQKIVVLFCTIAILILGIMPLFIQNVKDYFIH